MPDPISNIPASPSPPPDADLTRRLDAMGRAMVAAERSDPPAALLRAVRERRQVAVVARIGMIAGLAAAIALAVFVYFAVRPTPAPTPTPGPIAIDSSTHTQPGHHSPTLAALRHLNRDASPETLRLPTAATAVTPKPIRAADARDPDSISRILGPSR